MSIIQLNSGNCKNCYKCVRECPIKSIQFKGERAKILDSECILCGTCVEACPQNAKYVKNDACNVKQLIASGTPVYATLAPSWVGWYGPDKFEKLSKALKRLGFVGVEETAIGAAETSREYELLLQNGRMKNIVVTACSSIVMLIERHYPELINMLAPVSSPMMAHARLMRESYGDIKVVFIGPCLSKKFEAEDPLAGGLVNYALTFADIDEWFGSEGIVIDEADSGAVGLKNTTARLYPAPGGIIKTINSGSFGSYKKVAVDGIEDCRQLFECIIKNNLTGLFIEANLCSGGCMGGPVMRIGKRNHIIAQLNLSEDKQPRDGKPASTALIQFTHPRVFTNRSEKYPVPSEDVIRAILAKTGKYTPEQELNCSSCGYPTCRDKAIAVYQGKADINMCLPFFRDRAENISTTVIEHSPNAILALDKDMLLQEFNPAAVNMFALDKAACIGMPVPEFASDDAFAECRESGLPVCKKTVLSSGLTVEQTTIYIKEHNIYIAFVKDISAEEKNKEELKKLRIETIGVAQNVIDKQMRVAQEIASLLGETTAETKVALTNLKKTMSKTE